MAKPTSDGIGAGVPVEIHNNFCVHVEMAKVELNATVPASMDKAPSGEISMSAALMAELDGEVDRT